MDTTFEAENYSKKKSLKIFEVSLLTVAEFNLLFSATIEKISVPEALKDMLLDMIRLICLPINNIPISSDTIDKSIKRAEVNEFILCRLCQQEIIISANNNRKVKKCLTEHCPSNMHGLKSRDLRYIYTSDIKNQISIILRNHFEKMNTYKGK